MAPAPINYCLENRSNGTFLSADMFAQSNCNIIIKSLAEDWSVLHESYVHLYDQIFDVSQGHSDLLHPEYSLVEI